MSNTRDVDPAVDAGGAGPFDPARVLATLSAAARRHQVPGAQLAIHHSGTTIAVEVGELEHRTGRSVPRDAAFPVGSITKSFTAAVAMILVADGEIELDAPLGEYLPELRHGADQLGAQGTLRQLLSHTSGLPEGPDPMEVGASSVRRYVLDHCRGDSLVFPPGTCFSYSNIAYALVGHLIEVITGMTWWEAMESVLLRPLGIEPTFLVTPDARPVHRPVATGHSVNPLVDRVRPVEQSLPLALMPAGGLAVSAMDLVTFGLIELVGQTSALLPSAQAEQMRQAVPHVEPFGLADGWGLGLALFRSGDTTWVGHDGNADGTACYLRVEPVSGCVVAFTSNANIGLSMWLELMSELRGAGLPFGDYSTVAAVGRPTAPPPGCAGSYMNGDSEYLVTAHRNGDLLLAVDGEVVARLDFHEGLVFSQHDVSSGMRIHAGRFLRDPITGELDRIQVGGRLARRRRSDAA